MLSFVLSLAVALDVSPADLDRLPDAEATERAIERLRTARGGAALEAVGWGFATQREEAWARNVVPYDLALAAWEDLREAHCCAGGGTAGWPPRTCEQCLRSLRRRVGREAYLRAEMPEAP
jgi:hypothetical protein